MQVNERFLNVEKIDNVVITPEEARAIYSFCESFRIPLTPKLVDSVEAFCSSPTAETQEVFRVELVRFLYESDHEIMKDPLMMAIRSNLEEFLFHRNFDDQVKELCTKK